MSRIVDLFGHDTEDEPNADWARLVNEQPCPFVSNSKCYKVRKSEPEIAVGTCTVRSGRDRDATIICPRRFLKRTQVFVDCLHLLKGHVPGNDLHVVPEVGIPGGSVDYFLVSVRGEKIEDFVGIELQALDTTGTVWPARQQFVATQGVDVTVPAHKPFGLNWKMTAKTTLVQLHHKAETFEHVNKSLVLVLQDRLLDYMTREFTFGHLSEARLADPMHFHAYRLDEEQTPKQLALDKRLSTDTAGIERSLGLQVSARVELETIIAAIQKKITNRTLLQL